MSRSKPPTPRVGRTLADSEPAWASQPRAPEGTPNVVFIVFDDVGYSDFGCYGSEIATPHLDALAAGGLRYTGFHTTGLCSATRACLMTGRNHHRVGMATLTDWDLGFPGSRGRLVPEAATLAEWLRPAGWNTAAVGKWHLTPMRETTPVGPFDQWPLQRGFDRFYGFFDGETNHWFPELTRDNHRVDEDHPPGYHLSADLVDEAIALFRDQKALAPEKPLFLNLAFGAGHAPHQVPREFIEPYLEVFAKGYDQTREDRLARQVELGIVPEGTRLTPRHEAVKPWEALSPERQRAFIHLQAAYAGMLEHADAQVGRLVSFLECIGQLDNTLIFAISDNGASQEGTPIGTVNALRLANGIRDRDEWNLEALGDLGGPLLNNNYPLGWAMAGNTPLKRFKQNVHGGGVRDPLIVHWPRGIAERGGLRHGFHHVADLPVTVMDVVGVEPGTQFQGVEQLSFDGVSLAPTFDDPGARPARGPQVFELFGHRAIVDGHWKAVAWHEGGTSFDDDAWELYDLDRDYSEFEDLAETSPERLHALQELWWKEAERNRVLPLDDRPFNERWVLSGGHEREPRRFEFWPGMTHLPSEAAPDIRNRSYRIDADVEFASGDEGVLIAHGDRCSGWTLFVAGDRLVHHYNRAGERTECRSAGPIAPGKHTLSYVFTRTGEHRGTGELRIDDTPVGEAPIDATLALVIAFEGLDVGRDALVSVCDAYESPFDWTGTLHRVVFTLGEGPADAPPVGPAAERHKQ